MVRRLPDPNSAPWVRLDILQRYPTEMKRRKPVHRIPLTDELLVDTRLKYSDALTAAEAISWGHSDCAGNKRL